MPDQPKTPHRSQPQTKTARRDAARETSRRMREEAERKQKRTRTLVISATAVVIVALIVVVALVVNAARPEPADPTAVPANTLDGGIPTGESTAPVTVEVYLDYQCPVCQQFEATNADYLDGLRADGKVQVVYKPIAILDRLSGGTMYSTRAASAAGCVAEADPSVFAAWNDAMFTEQPAENGTGLPDSRLVEIATTAGAPDSVSSCITGGSYEGWVTSSTEAAATAGYSSTPTVLVSGPGTDGSVQPLEDRSLQGLTAAVTAAAGSTTG